MASRLAWLILVILAVTLWAVGSIENAAEIPATCPRGTCDPFALSAGDLAVMADLNLPVRFIAGYFAVTNMGFALVFFTIAGAIAWRKSADWMGLLVSFTLVYIGALFFTSSDDALWRAYPASRTPLALLGMIGYASIMLLLFYFPDGRFVPRGRVARIIGWLIILLTTPFVGTATRAGAIGTYPFAATVGLGLAAQIHRYRRVSGPVQRQQTKWIVFGLATSLAVMLIWVFAAATLPPGPPSIQRVYFLLLNRPLIVVLIPVLPVTIAFSILRYRLWDVDVVINRTLVYGVLTASVVGVYALVVGALGTLFQARGNWIIALIATGLVAVLFQPMRERLQSWVNHLIYGHRDEPFEVLARLGQQLESTLSPEMVYPTIVETVAQTLRLPYAAIAVKQGERFETVESYGKLTSSPVATYRLMHRGEVIGNMLLGQRAQDEEFSEADERLLRNIARQAGIAVHNVQLATDLQRARRQLVNRREEERRRLRRDLHDGLGPTLASLRLQTGVLLRMIRGDADAAETVVKEFRTDLRTAIDDIRRVAYELRPPVLDELGLVAAIRARAAQYDRGEAGELVLKIQVDAPEKIAGLPAAVEVAAYRIVQEALTNVARHSQADRCLIRIHTNSDLIVEISDNGVGLPAEPRGGLGHLSMRERAEELGGTFVIGPSPDGGTRVCASLPLLLG
ncbi:MAG: GAF domain-containing sensor histidine kinase [Anaerolineales bacterium]